MSEVAQMPSWRMRHAGDLIARASEISERLGGSDRDVLVMLIAAAGIWGMAADFDGDEIQRLLQEVLDEGMPDERTGA